MKTSQHRLRLHPPSLCLGALCAAAWLLLACSGASPPRAALASPDRAPLETYPSQPGSEELREAILALGRGDRLSRAGRVEEAREEWLAAADHYRRAGDGLGEADAYTRLGNSLLFSGEFLANDEAFERCLDYFFHSMSTAAQVYGTLIQKDLEFDPQALRQADDLLRRARNGVESGRCPEAKSDLDEARQLYRSIDFGAGEVQALALGVRCLVTNPDRMAVLQALPALMEMLSIAQGLPVGDETSELRVRANELLERGEYPQAQQLYEQLIERYEAEGDVAGAGAMRLNLGGLHAQRREFATAERLLRRALQDLEAGEDDYRLENLAAVHHNLAGVALETGRPVEAEAEARAALTLWRALGRPDQEVVTLVNQSAALSRMGRIGQARAGLEEASRSQEQLPFDPAAEAHLANQLGTLAYLEGDYQEALAQQQRAHELLQGVPFHALQGPVGAHLGLVQAQLGRMDEAREALAEGVSSLPGATIGSGSGEPMAAVGSLLGVLAGRTSSGPLGELRTSLSGLTTEEDPLISLLSLGGGALVSQLGGDLAAADEAITALLGLPQIQGFPTLLSRLRALLASLRSQRGRHEEALALAQESLKIALEIGDPAALLLSRLAFTTIEIHRGDFEAALPHVQAAVAALEELQTVITIPELKTSFLGQLPFVIVYHLAAALAARQGEAEVAFRYLEQARARAFLNQLQGTEIGLRPRATSALAEEERQQRMRLAYLEQQLEAEQMGFHSSAWVQLQENLEEARRQYGEILLHLGLDDPGYASLVSPEVAGLTEVQRKLMPGSTTLVEFLAIDPGRWEFLVGDTEVPVLAWIVDRETAQVVILALGHSELRNQIALFRHHLTTRDPQEAEVAEELYTALIAPLLPHLKHRRLLLVPHGVLHYLPFAALKNPSTGRRLAEDFTLLHAPSATALRLLAAQPPATGGEVLVLGDPDGTLPQAREEARAVAVLYGTQPRLGDAATETLLRNLTAPPRLLHIAAHGTLDPANPLFSRLDLAAEADSDGHLEEHEVFALELAGTEVVVLSACDTQRGEATAGDEIPSLARAFLVAGARSVVASLWPVDDEATADLMEHFHRNLKVGLGAAEALRQAQLKVRETHDHPYFWAGFSVTGVE